MHAGSAILTSSLKRRTQQGCLLCYAQAQATCFSGQTSCTLAMLPRTGSQALSQPSQQPHTQVRRHDGDVTASPT